MPNPPDTPDLIIPVPPDRVITDPARLRWGVVSTIRAPLGDIARFAAYHLDLGARKIHVYLDEPDPRTVEFFSGRRDMRITTCNDDYWANKPQKARHNHQLRQAFNATRSYRRSRLDWMAHIDVDEFILASVPISEILAAVPGDAAFARMRPAELLAQPDPWTGPAHFKLTRHELGLTKAVLETLYPDFGAFVPEGFLSYTGAKNFARTGLPQIRLGIHALLRKGVFVQNGHTLTTAHVGHAHAPSWEIFEAHFDFRMTRGSYRKKKHDPMKLRDVLELVLAEDGKPGLRRFYDQMCLASPKLLAGLAAHDMLLTARLDLNQKVQRWFGDLPAGEGKQR
jgi:Glycosyl transferase family 2